MESLVPWFKESHDWKCLFPNYEILCNAFTLLHWCMNLRRHHRNPCVKLAFLKPKPCHLKWKYFQEIYLHTQIRIAELMSKVQSYLQFSCLLNSHKESINPLCEVSLSNKFFLLMPITIVLCYLTVLTLESHPSQHIHFDQHFNT